MDYMDTDGYWHHVPASPDHTTPLYPITEPEGL